MPLPEFQAGRMGEIDEPRSAQPVASGVAVEQCRTWLNWAAAQIDACLASDSLASSQMLDALAEALGPAQPRSGPAPSPADDSVSAKMSAVIIAVQSHDRVMQGLTHVAEALRALHAHVGDAQRADSAESWRTLGEKQYRTFSMAQERALFARMVAHEGESTREAEMDPEETVELFAIDDPDLHQP
jgi:hypothetical protein